VTICAVGGGGVGIGICGGFGRWGSPAGKLPTAQAGTVSCTDLLSAWYVQAGREISGVKPTTWSPGVSGRAAASTYGVARRVSELVPELTEWRS